MVSYYGFLLWFLTMVSYHGRLSDCHGDFRPSPTLGAWIIEPVGLTRRVWRRSRSIERLSFQGLVLPSLTGTPQRTDRIWDLPLYESHHQ